MFRAVLGLLIDGVVDVLLSRDRARSRIEWLCLPVGLGCLFLAVWITLSGSPWVGLIVAIVGTLLVLYWQ